MVAKQPGGGCDPPATHLAHRRGQLETDGVEELTQLDFHQLGAVTLSSEVEENVQQVDGSPSRRGTASACGEAPSDIDFTIRSVSAGKQSSHRCKALICRDIPACPLSICSFWRLNMVRRQTKYVAGVLVILAVLLAFGVPTVSGEDFFCEVCLFGVCDQVGSNDLGWANCYIANVCYTWSPCSGLQNPNCPLITTCNEVCTATESCFWDPTGW